MGQIINNAIAWVQFRIVGGIKSTILLAVAYAMVMVAICALIVMVNRGQTNALDNMPVVFLAIQGIVAGGITMFRILNAVQRDITGKQLESHRLMPIDPRLAVLGYAAGGGLAVMPLVVTNLLLGAIATSHAGLPLSWWLWANGVLLSWCAFAWCLAAGGSLLGPGIGILVLAPLLVTLVTGGAATLLMPGMAPLASPLAGRTIFRVDNIGSEQLVRWVLCMALELPLAWVLVLAGARRFRYGDIPGLTGPLACVLVLAFALCSIVAMQDTEMIPPHLRRSISTDALLPGTLVALMVLGCLAALSHVSRHIVEFHSRCHGRNLWFRDAAVLLVVLSAGAAFLAAAPDLPEDWPIRSLWSISELAIVLLAMLLWSRWSYRRSGKVGACIAIAGAWWVLPLIAGAALDSTEPWQDSAARMALQISPLAMFPAIWDHQGNLAHVSSLLMQLCMPVLAAALLRRRAVAAEPTAPPLVATSFTDPRAPVDSHRL